MEKLGLSQLKRSEEVVQLMEHSKSVFNCVKFTKFDTFNCFLGTYLKEIPD